MSSPTLPTIETSAGSTTATSPRRNRAPPTPPERTATFTRRVPDAARRTAARVRGPTRSASRSRSASVSTSSTRFGASTMRGRRERREARGAAGPVDRLEQRRSSESASAFVVPSAAAATASPPSGTAPASARRSRARRARQVGVDDEVRRGGRRRRRPRRAPSRTAAPWPRRGSATCCTPSGSVGVPGATTNVGPIPLARGEHVGQHRLGEPDAIVLRHRRQPALGIAAAEGNDDGRHRSWTLPPWRQAPTTR